MMTIRLNFIFVLSLAVSLFMFIISCFTNSLEGIIYLSAIPTVIYSDCGEDLKTIYKENRGKTGVYRFTNKITGDTYIGSAVNLSRRFREYFSLNFLNKEVLKNKSIIYRALLKYGYINFSLEILEYTDKSSVLVREQYYLDVLNPSYNICKVAGSSYGRITKENTRMKLRFAWKVRLFQENGNGINFSEFVYNIMEEKVRKSELVLNNIQVLFEKITKPEVKKKIVSDETKMKILFSTETALIVAVKDLETGITTSYPSARNAGLALGVHKSTILDRVKGKTLRPIRGRYLVLKGSDFC